MEFLCLDNVAHYNQILEVEEMKRNLRKEELITRMKQERRNELKNLDTSSMNTAADK